VILINLLPHREAKRRQRKQAFFAGVGGGCGLGLVDRRHLVPGAAAADVQPAGAQPVPEGRDRPAGRADQGHRLAAAEIDALKARQKAVEDLQTDRNTPVRLLDELVKQTPEGVYITPIRQTGYQVQVNGVAQTNERVSELLRNLLYNSAWLEQPDLVEIRSVNLPTAGSKETRRLFEYQLKVRIKQPVAPAAAAAASAASGPAKAS
jgi:type IV pilus assembly protein PilN